MDQYQPLRSWRIVVDLPQPCRTGSGLAAGSSGSTPAWLFGSGTHPTTALCLEWLDANDVSGKQVLDYGCGSGILAMAAALMGARKVVGVDHDPQALQATVDNAERK